MPALVATEIKKFLWPDERCADVRTVYHAFKDAGLYPLVVENTPRRLVVVARDKDHSAISARFSYFDDIPGTCCLETNGMTREKAELIKERLQLQL